MSNLTFAALRSHYKNTVMEPGICLRDRLPGIGVVRALIGKPCLLHQLPQLRKSIASLIMNFCGTMEEPSKSAII